MHTFAVCFIGLYILLKGYLFHLCYVLMAYCVRKDSCNSGFVTPLMIIVVIIIILLQTCILVLMPLEQMVFEQINNI